MTRFLKKRKIFSAQEPHPTNWRANQENPA